MINHVTLEVHEALMKAEVHFWTHYLGFQEELPYSDKYGARWVYRYRDATRTQVHLFPRPDPIVPRYGHVALCVREDIYLRLLRGGRTPEEGTRYWGERRYMVDSPSGHRVEIIVGDGPRPEGER